MNGNTKTLIKKQLINWIGIAAICLVSFYFTASATLKQHSSDINKKLDTELFDAYLIGINKLIESNYGLIEKDTEDNKEQIELLRASNKEIRDDIKTLARELGFQTRGIKLNTAER